MLTFKLIALIVLSVSSIYCQQVSYDNYKVFRIIPTNNKQIEELYNLENQKGFSFWMEPRSVSSMVDLQVAPTNLEKFYTTMNNAQMNYTIMVENLQYMINQQQITFQSRVGNFNFAQYHTLEEIYTYINELASAHSDTVTEIVGGQTYQGRQIVGVRLRFGSQKPGIFLEGGIHGREWLSPATVIYLIDKLVKSRQAPVRQLAERYDWYIFPVCNPDGYVHTHDPNGDRMWRKTLSDTGMGNEPENPKCKGVDLNRNYGFRWQRQLYRITDPCHERYPGSQAFSEIESRTMSDYIESFQGNLFAFISFHAYSQFLLFPFGHTRQRIENYNEIFDIASRAITALARQFGTQYRAGSISELININTGSSMDWAMGSMGLDLSFTYEMRDRGQQGFFLPPEEIIPNGREVLDSLVAMFQETETLEYRKKKKSRPDPGPAPGESSGSKKKKRKLFRLPTCFQISKI